MAGLSLRVTCIEGSCVMLNSGWLQSWVVLQFRVFFIVRCLGERRVCVLDVAWRTCVV